MVKDVLNKAVSALKSGLLPEAERLTQGVLRQNPENKDALLLLGQILLQTGRYGPAVQVFDALCRLVPGNPDFPATLGSLWLAGGNLNKAQYFFERSLSLRPVQPEALKGMGQLALRTGNFEEAANFLGKAERKLPKDPDVMGGLGIAWANLGQPTKAVSKFKALTRMFPKNSDCWNNLGNAQQASGDLTDAVSSYEKAAKLAPQSVEPHFNLGLLLNTLEEPEKALEHLKTAQTLSPGNLEIQNAIGISLSMKGEHEKATTMISEIVDQNPASPAFLENLGKTWQEYGYAEKACDAWDRAFKMTADQIGQHPRDILGSTPSSLFLSNCIEKLTAEELAKKIKHWAGIVMDPWSETAPEFDRPKDSNRPIRVAFLSPDFREHSVCYFFLPLIESWSDQTIEVYCYAHLEKPDHLTKRVKKAAHHWVDITKLSDREAAEKLKQDKIDIAIDLAGYSRNTRLGVLAYRPAPVQITWLGYPNTTGMKAVDYRIVDEMTDPTGKAEPLHTEKLLRLAPAFLCYGALDAAPEVADPPCLSNGYITFCSFNNRMKIDQGTIAAWTRILKSVPNSRLLIKDPCFKSADCRASISQPFLDAGIESDRLIFKERTKSKEEHLGLYSTTDIALDTFPYNGTTTTFEALWMGVPVVTLSGDRHAARVGETILRALNDEELIAETWDEYVEKAVSLAKDPKALAERRRHQREKLRTSRLMDGPAFAHAFAAALRGAWEDWCNTQKD